MIDLVEDHESRLIVPVNFLEHFVDGLNLFDGGSVGHIDHMHQNVRLHHFLQSRLEGFHELMRQLADEPNGVTEQRVLVGGQPQAARGGIQRREEFIFAQHLRAGEFVEQRGFAGVSVAHNRHQRPLAALAPAALCGAHALHFLQLAPQSGDAFLNAPAVNLQLRFPITAHADAAFLSRKVRPHPGQSRQDVLQLRHLDLHLAFARACALGEDVEDQRGSIQHLTVKDPLQVAGLRRTQFVIKDHRVHHPLFGQLGKFTGLAFTNEGGDMRSVELLRAFADDGGPGRCGQLGQFLHRFVHIEDVPLLELGAH